MFENFFKNLSIEDLLRWVRQIFQFLAGSGLGIGIITGDKWIAIGSIIASIVSFVWTLRANTVAAKTAELEKSPEIVKVVPSVQASPATKEAATGKIS